MHIFEIYIYYFVTKGYTVITEHNIAIVIMDFPVCRAMHIFSINILGTMNLKQSSHSACLLLYCMPFVYLLHKGNILLFLYQVVKIYA